MRNFFPPIGEISMILAKNKYLQRKHWYQFPNNNVMLVGATGYGKTRNFIKPNMMLMNSNYIVLDPSGNLVHEMGAMLTKHGYTVKVLNIASPDDSDSYNPFCHFRDESDVIQFVDTIFADGVFAFFNDLDTTLDAAVKALISAICFFLIEACNPEDLSFESIVKVLGTYKMDNDIRSSYIKSESVLDTIMRDLRSSNPDSMAVKAYDVFKSYSIATGTEGSVFARAEMYMQNLNISAFIDLTRENGINMDCLSTDKTAIFVIPSFSDKSFNWLARMFFDQVFNAVGKNSASRSTCIILDDFVCIGAIPNFSRKMSILRSKNPNTSIIISIQDEAQMDSEYGKDAQAIIANCYNYVFMGSPDRELCTKVAGRSPANRLYVSNLLHLPNSKCVVISGGRGQVYNKFDLKHHARYNEVFDASNHFDLRKDAVYHVFKPVSAAEMKVPVKRDVWLSTHSAVKDPLVENDSVDSIDLVSTDYQEALDGLQLDICNEVNGVSSHSEENTDGNDSISFLDREDLSPNGRRAWEIGKKTDSHDLYNSYGPYSLYDYHHHSDVSDVTAVLLGEDDDLCLYIKGRDQAATRRFSPYVRPPWLLKYRLQIKKVVVANGIASLGDYLFSDLPCLLKVELPASIRILGDHLFEDCPSLEDVSFPISGHSCEIGVEAFKNDISLKSISFPEPFRSIGPNAFLNCSGLEQLILPKTIGSIDTTAFKGCTSLQNIVSYNIDQELTSLPPYIQNYIDKFNVVLTRNSEIRTTSKEYSILGNSITFEQTIAPATFRKILFEALAKYFYIALDLSKESSDMYLKYRYDTYRSLTTDKDTSVYSYRHVSALELEKIFVDDLSHFKHFLFEPPEFKGGRRYTSKKDVPTYTQEVESYYDFISNVHFRIFVRSIRDDLIGIIRFFVGSEVSKRVPLKSLREQYSIQMESQITQTAFRDALDLLRSEGAFDMVHSGTGYVFSFPDGSGDLSLDKTV